MERWTAKLEAIPQELLYGEPRFVVEISIVGGETAIKDAAKQANLSANKIDRMVSEGINVDRYLYSKPRVYCIRPMNNMIYALINLNHAHFELAAIDEPLLSKTVGTANKRLKGNGKVEFILVDRPYEDGYLKVCIRDEHCPTNSLDEELLCKMLNKEQADPVRNNVCIDLGFTGHRNSFRDADNYGITRPRVHSRTMEEWSRNVFRTVTAGIDHNFPKHKSEIYSDEERNKCLAATIDPLNRIEAIRVAKTDKENLLKVHWDSHNSDCKQYGWVFGFIHRLWNKKTNKITRIVKVTYGKQCAKDFMTIRAKHGDCIDAARRTYEALSDDQKIADHRGFDFEGDRCEKNHTMLYKGWLYSSYSSVIDELFKKYPALSHRVDHLSALLANTPLSEMMDHFWKICEELLEDPCALTEVPFEEADPVDFGFAFSQEMFRRKKHSGNKAPEKIVDYPTKPRHAPAVNKPPTREQMHQSIETISELIIQLRMENMQWNMANTMHYYGKASEVLIEDAYGCGRLTSQHVLGIGACLGVFPKSFLSVAEIGYSTRTWKFLKWAFGYSDEDAYGETTILLRAIAVHLDITVGMAEELCCQMCKLYAPRVEGYEFTPCTINFKTCKIDVSKLGWTGGEVIYKRMFLYKLNNKGYLYKINKDGTWIPAVSVLSESLYKDLLEGRPKKPSYWNRRFLFKRSFHYKRAPAGGSVRGLGMKQYFFGKEFDLLFGGCQKEKWNLEGDHISHVIGKDLPKPSYKQMLLNIPVRQPLNIRKLVWDTLHGNGQYKVKEMLEFQSKSMHLLIPNADGTDSEHRSLRVGMFCCALKLGEGGACVRESTDGLYWSDPYFDLHPMSYKDPKLEETFDDMGYPVPNPVRALPKDDPEFLKHYDKNLSRVLESDDYRTKRRWFNSKDEAMYNVLFCFFFRYQGMFNQKDHQVRSLLFLPSLKKKGRYKRGLLERNKVLLDGTKRVNIYFDPLHFQSKRNKEPFFVGIEYERGGRAYYRCNSSGLRLSGMLLERPLGKSRKASEPGIMYEFIDIIGHAAGEQRSIKYPRSRLNLTVKWVTGEITEEPFSVIFEDCPLEVVRYGDEKGLLETVGWAKVRQLKEKLQASKRPLKSVERKPPAIKTEVTTAKSSPKKRAKKQKAARNDTSRERLPRKVKFELPDGDDSQRAWI